MSQRHIEPEMVQWLDEKLRGDGLTQRSIEDKNARYVFGRAVESCVGIRESGGNNNGPLVKLLQETIGGADREPWCMALIQTGIAYAELKTGVKSPLVATEHCMTCWNDTPHSQRVKASPLKYAIAIWNLYGTNSGHTGLVVESYTPQWFMSVEGNTGALDEREGDCVALKKRNWLRTGNLVRVGFLKPF